jgi:hypothetical protein
VELQAGRRSPVELARRFDDAHLTLSSLAYHVRALVAAGLVELALTTPRRGAVEHSYVLTQDGRLALRVVASLRTT